jgi:hypothetical protein
MSKRRWVASRVCAVLGGAALAVGLCVPRASAANPPPPWDNTNYAGRYVCNWTSDDDFFDAVAELEPNGAGTYTAGSLEIATSAFTAFDETLPPPGNFCSYTLAIAGSSYSIGADGTGIEVLQFTASPSNNTSCADSGGNPLAPGTFEVANAIVLRLADLTPSGASIRDTVTSSNLLDEDEPGFGYCEK